MSYLWGDTFTW